MAGALALAACGGSGDSGGDDFDADRACRIGQRLVDEVAEGDRDGVITQIERLDDLDGVDDSSIDVDDLDELAEGLDENAVEDLISEFEALDCDLEVPATTTPVDTEPEPTTPPTEPAPETVPPTEPPPETTPTTEPAPETTETPAPTTAPETPPAGGASGIPVDIGSTGPGPSFGVDRPTEAIISEFRIPGILYSPNTNVVELRISRRDATFSDDIEWTSNDSIVMSATTSLTIEEVRAAYRTAVETLGFEYDFSESTSSSDGTNAVGLEASPTDFDAMVPRWDISIAQSDDVPGIVLIEVDRSIDREGTLPAIPAPATELLQGTADIGSDLGWTVTGFRYSESANTFSDGTFVSGTVDWDISEENTVRESATALQDAVGIPIRDEEVEDDRITWFLDDDSSTLFSVNYFEFGGTSASFNP
jgi:hypothetical protein